MKIVPFQNKYQTNVDELLQNINSEFEQSMFSSASIPMQSVAQVIGNQFWVATMNDVVIGTIGVMRKKNNCAVVKSMFVAKEYRGTNTAFLLLSKMIDHCKRKKVQYIYLGTMNQMKAAHRFYEKDGFKRIMQNQVPVEIAMNPVDDVFYLLTL